MDSLAYWSETQDSLFFSLKTTPHGLSQQEAEARLKIYGLNELAKKKKKLIIWQFLSKFISPLIFILLVASIISALVGDITEFLIIQATVIIGVIIDFYQEYQAEQAAEKLRQKVSLTASVLRNNITQEIKVAKLVPGDVIFLSVGDIVSADCRLLTSQNLLVDQAVLTGESFPQEKDQKAIVLESASLVDYNNVVFMGTTVVSGEGTALVVRTGNKTEFGKISKELVKRRPKTEFEKGMRNFGYLLMKIVLILVLIVFFVNAFLRHEILQSFLFALALAVGITPELLPMIITINLSKGALRMAKKKVIVKDLQAIQNLGSMEVLCTDKTGTLTESTIKLVKYEDISQKENEQVLIFGYLNSAYQKGLKSPLAQSVVKQFEGKLDVHEYEMKGEVPFDFNRKRLSVIVKHKNKLLLITTGAPEGIIANCNKYQSLDKEQPLSSATQKKIDNQFIELSKQGFRVVATAYRQVVEKSTYKVADEKDLIFLGFMAFFDPPKSTVKEVLPLLAKLGVELKILTGDSLDVTKKVCEEIGLEVKNVLLGEEIEKILDEKLKDLVKQTTIFARLNPEQKKRIIMALKQNNLVVGFLGDGINDVLPLREADVGISVNNAVDVAKEAADLILLHKDLHVLKNGVEEGRKTYGNVMKYILMESSSNFGNMFSVAIASLFLPFLPMLPVQILLNNLLYEASQLGISSDKVDAAYLQRPKKWNIQFIKHFMLVFGPVSSIFDLLTYVIMLFVFKASVSLFQTGWFIESLTTQALVIFSIRTKTTPFYKSQPSFLLWLISLVVIAISWILPFTPLALAFNFVRPPLKFYVILVIMVLTYIFLVEEVKKWFYRKYNL